MDSGAQIRFWARTLLERGGAYKQNGKSYRWKCTIKSDAVVLRVVYLHTIVFYSNIIPVKKPQNMYRLFDSEEDYISGKVIPLLYPVLYL